MRLQGLTKTNRWWIEIKVYRFTEAVNGILPCVYVRVCRAMSLLKIRRAYIERRRNEQCKITKQHKRRATFFFFKNRAKV